MRPRIVIQIIAAIVLTCAAALAFSVWAYAEDVRVQDAYAPPTLGSGATGAVYMRVTNDSAFDDDLLAVKADLGRASMHRHADENGVMTMKAVSCIDVPAHGEVTFSPGGLHVMLTGLASPLKVGDRVHLTLVFRKAGEVPVDVAVKPRSTASVAMTMGSGVSGSGTCD